MQTTKFQKRLFGTNGVRGIVGKDLPPELVVTIGEAFGTMRKGCIAVGRDTRTSGDTLVKAIKSGLLATGCDVVDCGILPTPALQYIIKGRFAGGVMITASHNPPEYNGVKIIEADGTEMGDEETLKLEQLIFDLSFSPKPWEHVGHEVNAPHLIRKYIKSIINHFPHKIGSGMTVVVDPGSGPACLTSPHILTGMGCRVLTLHGVPDGTFPGRLPEPSSQGLKGLAELVVSSGAAFGIAHDGDADRAVFVDENGQFIEENEEFTLVASYICHQEKGAVVTPVSTSLMVEKVVKNEGCTITYTPVGSIYVARTMRSLIENGNTVVFGGEGNGGLIFPRHQFCRDGGMTAAMMVYILASTGEHLSSLVRRIPKRTIIKDKVTTSRGAEVLESLKKEYSYDLLDLTDGVKILREDSWALVRVSGTEPIIRIIVDADSYDYSKEFHEEVMAFIHKITDK
ncbi:MAG: phosphoglucosamine mutase [Methanoregula sp.]|nr:phosphoglucosamine mutase [Methanoregula sp.]